MQASTSEKSTDFQRTTIKKVSQGSQAALPVVTALFIFALITPVIITLGPIALNPARLVLLFSFIPCLYLLLAGKRGPIVVSDICFMAFVSWFGIAMFYHHGAEQFQRVGQNLLDAFGAYLLARITIRNADQFKKAVTLLAIASGILIPWALLEAITGRVFLNEILDRAPFWISFRHVDGPTRLGLDRAQAAFEHPILYGVFSSSLVALIVMVQGSKIWAIPTAIGGILSLSTAALLQLVLQFFMLSWGAILKGIKQRWKILVILVVFGYVVIDLLSDRSPLRVFISYATFNVGTGYHRIHIWNYGSQNVIDNPIFGIGNNDWERPNWLHSASVDNFWLVIAMGTGFPSVIALISGVISALVSVLRKQIDSSKKESIFRTAWVITIITFSTCIATVHVWNATYSFFFFLIGSGIWLAQIPADNAAQSTIPDTGSKQERINRPSYTRFPHK